MRIGYVKQTFKHLLFYQKQQLKKYGCDTICVQPANNSNYKSKILKSLKEDDTFIITRFVVVAEDLKQLLELLQYLHQRKVTVVATEHDFNSFMNIHLHQLIHPLLQFIEDVRYQRQVMGIIKAKARGKHIGRPRKLSSKKILKAIDLHQYYTTQQVANKFSVSKSTLLRNMVEYRNKNKAG